jgi:hypothetical protein
MFFATLQQGDVPLDNARLPGNVRLTESGLFAACA